MIDNDSNRLSRMLVESSSAGDVYGHGLISEHRGSDVNTYHFDYRGSTVAMTDASGSVKGTASYDEYGVKLSNALETRFTYNGQFGVEDDGTGMYYMRTRYYNVDLKRFMNRDVVVGSSNFSQSLNRYAYVNGNPISYTDPFGMARETLEKTQGLAGFDIHLLLDVAGMIPVIGEFADATNAVLYLSKGQYVDATVSASAMIPIVGNLGTGARTTSKVVGKIDTRKSDYIKKLRDDKGYKNPNRTSNTVSYIKEVDITYKIYEKNPVEFFRQLKMQENGINKLAAGELRKNIDNYKKVGRGSLASKHNRDVRNNNVGISKDQVVLHNPDMVIGGYPDRGSTLGDRKVNSSLGSQNRHKQKEIMDAIEGVADDKYVKFNFKGIRR